MASFLPLKSYLGMAIVIAAAAEKKLACKKRLLFVLAFSSYSSNSRQQLFFYNSPRRKTTGWIQFNRKRRKMGKRKVLASKVCTISCSFTKIRSQYHSVLSVPRINLQSRSFFPTRFTGLENRDWTKNREQRPYFLLLHYPSKWKRTKRIEPIFDNNVKIARLVKLVKDGGEQTLVVLLVKV